MEINNYNISDDELIKTAIIANGVPEFIVSTNSQIKTFTNEGDCPEITLKDLTYSGENQYVVLGETSAILIGDMSGPIDGGVLPATIEVEGGALPTGMSIQAVGDAVAITGDPSEFGIFTFTLRGTDANGCPITVREYTIRVYAKSTNNSPRAVTPAEFFEIVVSGLPNRHGTGVSLESIRIDLESAVANDLILDNPTQEGQCILNDDQPTGDITGAIIYNSSAPYPLIGSGTTPYNGNWASFTDFANFDGYNTNGNWAISGVDGTINSITLLFKPI